MGDGYGWKIDEWTIVRGEAMLCESPFIASPRP